MRRARRRCRRIVAKYPPGRQASAVLPMLYLVQKQMQAANRQRLGAGRRRWTRSHALGHGADPCLRGRDVLPHVQPEADRQVPSSGLHHDAMLAARLGRGGGGLPCGDRYQGWGETSADGVFTMTEVECLGACVNAPIIQVNDDFYEDLDADSTKQLLEALRRGEPPQAWFDERPPDIAPEGGPTTLTTLQFERS